MLSISQIVRITGRSRNTIYKGLKEHLGYVYNTKYQKRNSTALLSFIWLLRDIFLTIEKIHEKNYF